LRKSPGVLLESSVKSNPVGAAPVDTGWRFTGFSMVMGIFPDLSNEASVLMSCVLPVVPVLVVASVAFVDCSI
jgi:hypothetical protein